MKTILTKGAKPIYAWTEGVELEASALKQLQNTASVPIIFDHLAVMPDVHWGMGSTVGSVVATRGAIIPACVGVDIGCGMVAQRLSIKGSDLKDKDLGKIRSAIERLVPHGRTGKGAIGTDRGAWGAVPEEVAATMAALFSEPIAEIVERNPGLAPGDDWHNLENRAAHQLGTLGTGNHFIEICVDESDNVWIMLHSGSRGFGNIVASYFITKAKERCESAGIVLPDKDLAWFEDKSKDFSNYIAGLNLAQAYAFHNRQIMLGRVRCALISTGLVFTHDKEAINCHHNYVAQEKHFGKNVWITRKGAVRAGREDYGIIPGSMGAKSFIVQGKGNALSFESCSHGAGRRLSRGEAKRTISMDRFAASMGSIESRRDADVIDEAPDAYKSIDAVMAAQADLVTPIHTLKQLIVVKG
jgi:tRNA-splicing ligase RtcB